MATIIITGEVQAKRISDLTAKAAAELLALLGNYHIAIDNPDETESFEISLSILQELIGGIFRPAIETVLVGSVLTLNAAGNTQAMFEPRKTAGDPVIDVNFTHVFEEVASANLISEILRLTGTITITMPSDVTSSLNPSPISVWDDALKELTINAGTADVIEFQFLRDITGGNWLLKVAEVSL